MKEHVQEAYVDLDEMTEPQLMAQYFRSFDLDRNGRIDGLEMLKAILRMNSEHAEDRPAATEEDIEDTSEDVDEEMDFYDENGDGLISYPEFMRNHRKRIAEMEEQ